MQLRNRRLAHRDFHGPYIFNLGSGTQKIRAGSPPKQDLLQLDNCEYEWFVSNGEVPLAGGNVGE